MDLKAFYHQLLQLNSYWAISSVDLDAKTKRIDLYLNHDIQSKFPCPQCGLLCGVYDHNSSRCWRHLDTCDYFTYLHACLPRISCTNCGIHTIEVSWADSKSRFTLQFESYIIDVLGQTQVVSRSALLLRLCEHQVRYVRDKAVKRGLSRREDTYSYKVTHLCIDEKSLFKGHHYVTIFYNGDTGAILEVVEHRTIEATNLGFKYLGQKIDLSKIEVVTMDMWEAFKNATQENLINVDIVHDRFHIVQHLNKAIDIIRRAENKRLVKQADERLKKTKYLWLKKPENLAGDGKEQLYELLKDKALKTVQAYQLKEDFNDFFNCKDAQQAQSFFTTWSSKVEQSEILPLIKVSKMLEKNMNRILTYFKHRVTNAIAEGKNAMIQQIKCKARGFKSAKAYRKSILFYCGELDLYP